MHRPQTRSEVALSNDVMSCALPGNGPMMSSSATRVTWQIYTNRDAKMFLIDSLRWLHEERDPSFIGPEPGKQELLLLLSYFPRPSIWPIGERRVDHQSRQSDVYKSSFIHLIDLITTWYHFTGWCIYEQNGWDLMGELMVQGCIINIINFQSIVSISNLHTRSPICICLLGQVCFCRMRRVVS